MENSRELDGVVHGYRAKLGIRHRSGIGAKTKDRCILTGDRLPKGRTVREALRKQPCAVELHECVVVAERGDHELSLSILGAEVMRQAIRLARAAFRR